MKSEATRIRVSVVEDDEHIRDMLINILEKSPGLRCVSGYADAESAIIDIPLKAPDVVLMDIQLPGQTGIKAIETLHPRLSKTDFIVFTVFEDTDRIFAALKAGAVGYLLKSSTAHEIREAILDVRAGGSPMSPQIARKVVRGFKSAPAPAEGSDEGLESLSARESEILALLSTGLTYKEIAAQLFLSTETVNSHVRNVYRKLQVRSRTEAVIRYLGHN